MQKNNFYLIYFIFCQISKMSLPRQGPFLDSVENLLQEYGNDLQDLQGNADNAKGQPLPPPKKPRIENDKPNFKLLRSDIYKLFSWDENSSRWCCRLCK